jgi:hypothetical protein
MNGYETDIQTLLTEFEVALSGEGLLTRASAPPYTPLTAAQFGDGNWALDQPSPGGVVDGGLVSLTQDQAGAVYNYILVARGGAYGVHNPKYIGELLYDSYVALTGAAPTNFARP